MRRTPSGVAPAALAALPMLLLLIAQGALADASAPPGPRELRFGPGHSSVTVTDAVIRGERHVWRFEARAGQAARLAISALESNAVFQVWRPGVRLPAEPGGEIAGQTLPGAAAGDDAVRWRGRLPDSGSYAVVVGPTRGNASYTLTLKIEP